MLCEVASTVKAMTWLRTFSETRPPEAVDTCEHPQSTEANR
jgi:hypothetical protein